jgi:hypothetical protein
VCSEGRRSDGSAGNVQLMNPNKQQILTYPMKTADGSGADVVKQAAEEKLVTQLIETATR